MAGTATTEERLAQAHRLAAEAVGRISLSITTRRLSRTELEICVRLFRDAVAELEQVLGRGA